MTLESLTCFKLLVEMRSVSGAATMLRRSQPAVSQQLKSLEKELGGQLFDRKTGEPTERGKLLYAGSYEILWRVDHLRARLQDFDEDAHRELRIGSSDTTAQYVLPPLVRRFLVEKPHCRVTLVNRPSGLLQQEVEQGTLDLAVVTSHTPHERLAYEPLFAQKLVIAAPSGHPFAKRKQISLELAASEQLLLLDESTRTGQLIRRIFNDSGLRPRVLLDSGSFEVIKAYIAEGTGISILPAIMIGLDDSRITAIPLRDLPGVPVGIIYRKDAYISRNLEHFLELLRGAGTQMT